MKARRRPEADGRTCRGCRALLRWIDGGGPLPDRLMKHLRVCPRCLEWATRVIRVQGALTMLETSAPPPGLLGRANEKALRMLVRSQRDSPQAEHLRRARPPTNVAQWLGESLSRMTAVAAAAAMILSLRAGLMNDLAQAHRLAEALGASHYQRHIDDARMLS